MILHPVSRTFVSFLFLSAEEKRRVYLNRLKPLKSLKPELLDYSIWLSLLKLVFRMCASIN